MTCRTYLTLSVAILCLAGCSKSGSKPNTPPTDSTSTTATLNINCYLPYAGPQTELIVSEPGGKILLDTVANNNGAAIVAALKTNDTLVDATFIEPVSGTTLAYAKTFKSVNLARFTSLDINDYKDFFNYHLGNIPKSQIIYYNVPAQASFYSYSDGIFFTNYPNNEFNGSEADPTDRNIEVTYQNYNGNYAYMLFPQAGLYSLHLQKNTVDSVDCSHLDTAVQLTFNRPVPFTEEPIASTLWGILDTTDLSQAIGFTDYTETSTRSGIDFEYAPVSVQKYEMDYYATYSNNDVVNCFAYTNTLPQTLPLVQESDFSISSAQTDNFSVTFPNTKPTFYQVAVSDSSLTYSIYLSPDSSTVHPLTFLTNLKSKLLSATALGNLRLNQFNMSDFNGFNYLSYYSYITNPTAIQAHHVVSINALTRNY